MKTLLNKLSTWFTALTQFNLFNRSSQIILLLHFFYCVGDGLSNIFVSIYIWKLHQNLSLVAWFHLYQSLASFLLSICTGYIIKRHSPQWGIGIGTAAFAIFYLGLLLFQESATQYLPLFGLLKGTGIVLYWTSLHYFVLSFTNDHERHQLNGYLEVVASTSNLIIPLVASGMITLLSGNQGYTVIFLLSFLFFLTTTITSLFLKLPYIPKQLFQIKPILSDAINPNKNWFWGMQANFMQGLSDGIFMIMAGVVYFLFLHNEWNIGLMTSFLAGVTIIGNFLVGRFLTLHWRIASIFLATITHSCCAILFFLHPSWITVFLLGLGNSFVKPWYYIPSLSTFFDDINQKPEKEERYVEYLIARELALNLGRTLSLAILLWFAHLLHDEQLSLKSYTLIIALGLPYIGVAVRRLVITAKKD